jgi:hypothetical protein
VIGSSTISSIGASGVGDSNSGSTVGSRRRDAMASNSRLSATASSCEV